MAAARSGSGKLGSRPRRTRVDREVDRALMTRLRSDARRLTYRFGLRYRVLEAERANVKRRYGICYSDGTIRIRLRHASTRKPLRYSSLVNTLCHELAHLRHFHHGPSFQEFYARVLQYARNEGIYQPDRASGARRNEYCPNAAAPAGVSEGSVLPVPARAWHRTQPEVAPSGAMAVDKSAQQLPLFG